MDTVKVVELSPASGDLGDVSAKRRLFATASKLYPICVHAHKVRGRVAKKLAMYLMRHEDLWMSIFELMGWEARHVSSTSLGTLRVLVDAYRKLVGFASAPSIEAFVPRYQLEAFVERADRLEREYRAAAEGGGGPLARRVRRSAIYALVVRGTNREYLRREVRAAIRALLRHGVVPLDYGLGYVIVAVKPLKRGFWLSAFGENPVEILRGLYAPPGILVAEVRELRFEERGIGWGLAVVE